MVRIKVASVRLLLLFLIILVLLKPSESVNGVIWDKKSGNFVPIFSIPSFAAWNQEVLRKSREQEMHNFQGKTVRLSYFEVTNLINTEANGTKVSGAFGELWNILADHLNFTLKPILSNETTLGVQDAKGDFDGLLREIQLNKTDVVPRMEAITKRLLAAQLTMSLWTTKYRMYIRREDTYESFWMLKLFSLDLWHAILWMYFLITACSYVSHVAGTIITHQKIMANLRDHVFYNFGMIYCDQSYVPESISVSSCIVEFCLGIFCLLIRTAFGALVFDYLSKVTPSLPFDSVPSLLDRTSYNFVVLSGSGAYQLIKEKIGIYGMVNKMNRYVVEETMEDVFRTVCSTDGQYATFESDDIKKAAGLFICRLNPAGKPLFELSVSSGLAWTFEYKKTIDLTILRLHEAGIIRLLKERWVESKNVEEEAEAGADPINMAEVYLILCALGIGWCLALLIFILENIIHIFCNKSEPSHHISVAKYTRRGERCNLEKIIKPTRRRIKRIKVLDTRGTISVRRY